MDKICAVRQLFAVKFWQQIISNTLVVNIDKTSINRHIKSNFSWGIKGISNEAINSPFVGSISLKMAIWSNGGWMAYMDNETIDGNKFCIFLSNLNKWIQKNNNFGYKDVIIILDNSSVHKTNDVKKLLKKIEATVLFLSPYSPQFTPIEMHFELLKRYLLNFSDNECIWISQKENIFIIIKALKEIKANAIMKLFNNLFSLINKIV